MTPAVAALALLFLSVALYAAGFLALEAQKRDHGGRRVEGFLPPVSIVKPLAGLDDDLEENLESFYRLDYPCYEIVFSFARATDAAFPVARRVAARHPGTASHFVLDAREPGGNSKVNRLAAGLGRARHEHILMADGNVRVRPDFLARAVSFFDDPSVGLVSHLFWARGAKTLGSRLESLHLNGALRAGTAGMARILGMPCVVGKSILTSREALDSIGGIEALREHLAEDYLLGRMVARAGYQVVLSADEINTAEVSRTLSAAWSRQRRWAILRKRLSGIGYMAEILASPLPWFAAIVATCRGDSLPVFAGVALYLTRITLEALSAARSRNPFSLADWMLLLPRDAAVAALFWAGLFGQNTSWRGRLMTVGRQTLIERRDSETGAWFASGRRPAERGRVG